jgi:hypothetical protein
MQGTGNGRGLVAKRKTTCLVVKCEGGEGEGDVEEVAFISRCAINSASLAITQMRECRDLLCNARQTSAKANP